MNFSEMGIKPEIIKAIGELGFESPTPVQELCIPFILENKTDLIANAQTGTGKTAAFGLPVLEQIDENQNVVQALILSPTRELGIQIFKDLKNYSKYLPSINTIVVYGGAGFDTQLKELKRGGQIVVGTPGRVMDMIQRKALNLSHVRYLVLDEADEMLSMGFKDDLDTILAKTPASRQTLLFSATMPSGVEAIASNYMTQPHKIAVGKKNSGAENVKHIYYQVAAKDRYLALKRAVDMNPGIYGIVFTRTRREAQEVAEHLMKDGYNADTLHGDLSQPQREYVMSRFRNRHLQILVATDVAARGLDVDDLSHVINYNIPDDPEVYVHRSGRTGRAGKSGVSISIIHAREKNRIFQLEKMVGKTFSKQAVPLGREICKRQLFHLIDKMEKVEVDEKEIEPFLPEILKKLEWLSREELIKRFVSVEFNRFLEYYSDAVDLNIESEGKRKSNREEKSEEKRENRDNKHRKKNMNYSRFYINLGTKNGINPGKLIGLLTQKPEFKSIEIGDIELFKKFSFFEVDQSFENEVYDFLDKKDYHGLQLKVELTKASPTPSTKSKTKRGNFEDKKPMGSPSAKNRNRKPDWKKRNK